MARLEAQPQFSVTLPSELRSALLEIEDSEDTNGTFSAPNEETDEEDGVALYLERIGQYPRLSSRQSRIAFQYLTEGRSLKDLKNDEIFLGGVTRENGEKFDTVFADSRTVKELIVNCNLRWVVEYAKRFQGRGLPLLDLIQEGNIGLMKSIDKFDLKKNKELSTYATWWMRREIGNGIIEGGSMIRLPHAMDLAARHALEALESFRIVEGRIPTKEEWFARLRLKEPKLSDEGIGLVIALVEEDLYHVISGDRTVYRDSDETLLDGIEANDSTEYEALEKVTREELRAQLSDLTPQERTDIELRGGLLDGFERTPEEVARELGVSKGRERVIKGNATKKLQEVLRDVPEAA